MQVTATPPSLSARRMDGVLDWAQMLSGAGLIAFMWAHMILVASVNIGPNVMNAIAEFFEKTYMAQVGGPLIFLVFMGHFRLAARKIPFRLEGQKTIWEHAKMLHHTDTWLWIVQAGTAMVLLVMGAIHMWWVRSDLPITALTSAARVRSGAWIIFYLLLLPMVELHVGIGFYRIAVKWGIVQRDGRKGLKRSENMLTLIFIAIGLVTLVRFWFLTA